MYIYIYIYIYIERERDSWFDPCPTRDWPRYDLCLIYGRLNAIVIMSYAIAIHIDIYTHNIILYYFYYIYIYICYMYIYIYTIFMRCDGFGQFSNRVIVFVYALLQIRSPDEKECWQRSITSHDSFHFPNPEISQKRLQSQEETPRKEGSVGYFRRIHRATALRLRLICCIMLSIVYIYIYIFIHIYIYTYLCIYIYTYIHIERDVYIYICIRVCFTHTDTQNARRVAVPRWI